MSSGVVRSYGSLLFEMAIGEKKVSQYFNQVCWLLEVLTSSELEQFLSNLSIDKDERKNVFKNMFKSKLDKKIIYFIWTIIDFNRANNLEKILREFLDLYDEYYSISFVRVYSPYELTKLQLNKIKTALEKKFNKTVALENYVDETLIGGIKIESKKLSIDNTYKKKLELIKKQTLHS